MFEHLKNLEPQQTAEFSIYHMEGVPVLTLAPANQSNKDYTNAIMKEMQLARRAAQVQGKINDELLSEQREADRVLYPLHVFKGWTRMISPSTGEEIEPTPENVQEFFKQLPDWLFDEIRVFCGNIRNFVDPEATAGN